MVLLSKKHARSHWNKDFMDFNFFFLIIILFFFEFYDWIWIEFLFFIFRAHTIVLVVVSILFGLFICAIGCDQVSKNRFFLAQGNFIFFCVLLWLLHIACCYSIAAWQTFVNIVSVDNRHNVDSFWPFLKPLFNRFHSN